MTEYNLCAYDPVYFINKHVLKLKPFQEDLINQIHQHPSTLINSARQMGVTTVLAAYTLWLTLFTTSHTTALLDVKLATSIRRLDLIKDMNKKLTEELMGDIILNTRRELVLSNNSVIKIITVDTDPGPACSIDFTTVNFVAVDNAAFINNIPNLIKAIAPRVEKLVISSTLYKSGWFTDRCIEAEKNKSDYHYIKLPYYLDSKKRRIDRMHTERVIGEDMARVEWDCTHYLDNDVAKPLIDD